MRNDRGQILSRFEKIGDVVRELIDLKNRNKRIEDDPDLLEVIEDIISKHPELKIERNKLSDIVGIIDKLNSLSATGEEKVVGEENFGSSTVPTAKIRELVEEYEEHLAEGLSHEKAVDLVSKNNQGLVAKKTVAVFLERQRELYQEAIQELETRLGKEKAEQIAQTVATEQLLVEERLVSVNIDRTLAQEIAGNTIGKAVFREAPVKDAPKLTEESIKGVAEETTRQYVGEVLAQGVEGVNSRIRINEKVESITENLLEGLRLIDPGEVNRNKVELEKVIKEKVNEQIRGDSRLEEGSVSIQEGASKQEGPSSNKLSQLIVGILDLPPSKSAVVEKAIGEANIQATEWSEDKTKTTVDRIVSGLRNDPGVEAVVRTREDEIRRVAAEEIELAVSEGKSFEQVTRRVAEIIDPNLGKKVAVEIAVERASLETKKWSDIKIESVADELIAEIGGEKAAAKRTEIIAVISDRVNFSQLPERIAAILKAPESELPIISKAVTAAENISKAWDTAKTEQVVKQILSELSADNTIAAKLSSKEAVVRSVIAAKVERVVSGQSTLEEDTYKTPASKNLTEKLVEILNISPENVSAVNLAVKKAGLSVDLVTFSMRDGVEKIRAEHLRSEIEKGFVLANGKLTTEQIINVHNYADFVSVFYSDTKFDIYKNEAVAFAENRGNGPGSIKNAWNDLSGISRIIQMSPKQFKVFQDKFSELKEGVKNLKTPFEVSKLRSFEGLMKLTQDIPQINNLVSFVQNFNRTYSTINNFTGGFLTKIGLDKVGATIIERVGGQAMGEFVKQSLVVIAENGTQKGLMMILNGVLSGGVRAGAAVGSGAAGATAATGTAAAGGSGALSGAVAAFQAIPVVGQIILVAALAIGAAIVIGKAVKKIITGFTDALGIDLSSLKINTKKFLQDNFGKFFGGLMNFGLKVGMLVVAIPTILTGIQVAMSPLGPIIGSVFIGLVGIGLMTSLNVSAQVPRGAPSGVELYDYDGTRDTYIPGQVLPTRDPSIVIPESCPGIWPVGSGVITQGPAGPYSHYRSNAQAIDIGVGPVPIMATHDGWATPAGDGITGYGYYVDIEGSCNGVPFTTRYAHMPGFYLSAPKEVKRGEIIGYVDTTGNSTGNHLHYEIFGLGQISDWLPKPVATGCDSEAHPCNVSIP